jgi:hypothetical protein
MNSPRRALLLIGSAKRPRSTSESLGTYLLERLAEKGFAVESVLIHQSLRQNERREALFAAIDRADLLVLASPLYIDSLPSVVVRTMELIARRRRAAERSPEQRLVAIVNNGFPEARQNDTALAICRKFALETGIEWAGGLALGGGEIINGRPLPDMGRMARKLTRSLDLAATALAEDRHIPHESVQLMAKPLIPNWVYTLIGAIAWRWRAKKHGAHRNLGDCPYQIHDEIGSRSG